MDDRLPGKLITGKVKKLVFAVSGHNGCATASITLSCSLGTGRKNPLLAEKRDVYAELYCTPDVITDELSHQTVSGVFYRSCFDQLPERGHTFPAFLGARDILKGVTVVNTAKEQEACLRDKQYPHGHNLQQALRQVKTCVKLWFEDLRSVAALEHHIHVHIPHPWSAPKQVTLN
jgi:hypothetical protein